LLERVKETKLLVATIDRMLVAQNGGKTMTMQELFDGFNNEEFEPEAKEHCGKKTSMIVG